jgi:hypothetical protein
LLNINEDGTHFLIFRSFRRVLDNGVFYLVLRIIWKLCIHRYPKQGYYMVSEVKLGVKDKNLKKRFFELQNLQLKITANVSDQIKDKSRNHNRTLKN